MKMISHLIQNININYNEAEVQKVKTQCKILRGQEKGTLSSLTNENKSSP